MQTETKKPSYGNWVSNRLLKKLLAVFLFTGIAEAVLWGFVQGWLPLKILFALPMLFALLSIVYLYRARWWFAALGGNVQNKVIEILLAHIAWNGNGKALDIGCGSGALTVKLAKQYREASITGIDYWGNGWDYCQKQCTENASLEDVADRTTFQQASASQLPFPDETFDLVVSNLTFHEVKDSGNKLDAIKEALRVLKKGGKFVFRICFCSKIITARQPSSPQR